MAALPTPVPGRVIHFRYLWDHERERGLEEARYARPSAIVLTVTSTAQAQRVVVLPLTTREPEPGREALLMPVGVRRGLGLDAARSWIMLDEGNEFLWPGVDLEPNAEGTLDYGMVPPALFEKLRERGLTRVRAGAFRRVWRES